MIKGYAGRILEIDLEKGRHEFKPLDEDIARLYIGGKGYGTRLLYDLTEPGIDPLSPANPLIFATGPLTDLSLPRPIASRWFARAPLLGESATLPVADLSVTR